MEKNHWDTSLGNKILNCYQKYISLDKGEWEYIAICLAYPEKFWKIVNRYHNSRKSWLSSQNMAKLDKVINEQEARKEFLQMLNQFCEKIE